MKFKDILIIIVLVLPAAMSLFHSGFFGASDDMHIAWLHQMDSAIRMGQIPPRFISDLSFGFGYPLFNFIFPLPYYLAEIFHVLGLSFTYSIKAVFVFSLIASALSMYVLVKHYSGSLIGIAAAILYVYTPYRSTDIYDRGALGESLAFVFLPLIVYFLVKLSLSKNKLDGQKWIGLGALSISGLILTHNIVSYMFIPFAFLFGLYILRKRLTQLFLFFVIGLLGCIYFWLPALLDSGLMKYSTVFNFYDHFPSLIQLIRPYWGYGASVPGPYDGISFFVGEINLLLSFFVIVFLIFKYKYISNDFKTIAVGLLGLTIVSVFMMNFRSAWFWENLPLVPYFQFPWRFLTMIVFSTSFITVFVKYFRYSQFWSILIIILSILINTYKFKPHDFLPRDDSYFINRYIPVPVPSSEYLNLQEEYLRLPKNTEIRPTQVYPRVYPANEQISNLVLVNNLDAKFNTNSNVEMVLNYNKYYFPGFRGTIDGQSLALYAGTPHGQIQFKVPSGSHEIVIQYRETMRNTIFDIISSVTLLTCVYFALNKVKQ